MRYLPAIACAVAATACLSFNARADLFVSAAGRNAVVQYTDDGTLVGDFVSPGSGGLGDPQGITFGPDGNLYVASNASDNVLRFDGTTGDFIDVFASHPNFAWPAEINFRGDFLYVSDFKMGGRVARFNATTGAYVDDFVTGINLPDGQSWDDQGRLYVSGFNTAGPGTGIVNRYDGNTGELIDNFVTAGQNNLGGALDNLFLADGRLLVSSFNTDDVKVFSSDGTSDSAFGNLPGPQGLKFGPDGNLYAGSFQQGFINRYDPATLQLIDQFADIEGSTSNNFVFRAVPEPMFAGAAGLFGGLLLIRSRN